MYMYPDSPVIEPRLGVEPRLIVGAEARVALRKLYARRGVIGVHG